MGLFGGRMGQRLGIKMPPEEEERQGFWQGGGKFTARDGVAGVLAVIGDALAQQGGGQGGAVDMLGSGRMSALAMAKKAQEQQAQMQAARQRAIAAGVDPARAEMMANGDPNPAEWMPKEGDLPERARLAQWYQNASPQERAAFDQTNPIITSGYGSTVVPRSALPGGLDPDRYELIPDDNGGPTRPASGSFRSGPPRYRR